MHAYPFRETWEVVTYLSLVNALSNQCSSYCTRDFLVVDRYYVHNDMRCLASDQPVLPFTPPLYSTSIIIPIGSADCSVEYRICTEITQP